MRRITEGVGIYQYDKFEQDGVPIEILGHIPELFPDVARVAEEKGWKIEFINAESIGYKYVLSINLSWIEYNPTLSLLDQDEQLTLLPLLNKVGLHKNEATSSIISTH